MNVQTATVQTIDCPLRPGGPTLRVIQHQAPDGEPEALTLALGSGGAGTGEPFRRDRWGQPLLQLPPDAIEPLRDALTALLEDES